MTVPGCSDRLDEQMSRGKDATRTTSPVVHPQAVKFVSLSIQVWKRPATRISVSVHENATNKYCRNSHEEWIEALIRKVKNLFLHAYAPDPRFSRLQ